MASGPVKFKMVVTDNFTGRMARAAEVATALFNAHALAQATWEPHDWSQF